MRNGKSFWGVVAGRLSLAHDEKNLKGLTLQDLVPQPGYLDGHPLDEPSSMQGIPARFPGSRSRRRGLARDTACARVSLDHERDIWNEKPTLSRSATDASGMWALITTVIFLSEQKLLMLD
jgi:hypothetical protein